MRVERVPNHMTIVCYCFDVEKKRIVEAIDDGCRTVEAIKNRLGVTGNCAACQPDIESLIRFYGSHPKTGD